MVPRWQDVKEEDLSKEIAKAGIVGLGGAAFPSHVKLCPPKDQPVEVLLINGCECEPYLTTDYRLMVEAPEAIIAGAQTGQIGDGKIFVQDLAECIRIRTNDRGSKAIG